MKKAFYWLYIFNFLKFFIPIFVFFVLTFLSFRNYLIELEGEHLMAVAQSMGEIIAKDKDLSDNKYITSDYIIVLADSKGNILSSNKPGKEALNIAHIKVPENRLENTDEYLIYKERLSCMGQPCELSVALPKRRINRKMNLLLLSSLFSALVVSMLTTVLAILDIRKSTQEHKNYVKRLKSVALHLSHEIKTPLSVILTNLYNLNLEEEIRRPIERSIKRLIKLMRNLKILSEMDIKPENNVYVDVVGLLREIVEFYKGGMYGKSFKFNFTKTEEFEILSDYDLLYTMFLNLIDNAVKHSKDGSEILIEGDVKEEGILVISITNAVDSLTKLRKSSEDSYGIGLMIVQEIARVTGAKVSFKRDLDAFTAIVELCCRR